MWLDEVAELDEVAAIVAHGESLGLPAHNHLAYVVSDFARAIEGSSTVFDMQWDGRTFDHPSVDADGTDVVMGGYAAFSRLGEYRFEVVQPTTLGWPAAKYLAQHGEGFFHLGYHIDEDINAVIERATAGGAVVDLLSTFVSDFDATDQVTIAYLDLKRPSGRYIELSAHTTIDA